ncbi:MAG: serine/threonine-protein kinase [Chloroflexota bacterium]|nr:serine/threonine-protein kinase [Chloroflexota bacterium]
MIDEGTIIRGTYTVERLLGEGAFAEVYRVRHRFLGRQAMKVFRSQEMSLEETEELLAEPCLLSRIGHPNIVRVFEANLMDEELSSRAYFTMEYVAGGTLHDFWQAHAAEFVPLDVAIDVVRQVCRGVAVAHSQSPPIVHRDIKPHNILIGYDESGLRVRVSDFGLAKKVNPLTLLASARGTRAFKPPEFLSNVDSPAGDVWAIGSTLYMLLTDRLPFPAAGELAPSDTSIWKQPMIPASRLNTLVDAKLDAILQRALALRLADRFPDAAAMLDALETWRPAKQQAKGGCDADSMTSTTSKGDARSADHSEAAQMIGEAIRLSRQAGRLTEAADYLEQTINRQPSLRPEYEPLLRLWRRDVTM